jgi:CRP-like cAMP-binding protein
MRGKGKKA